MTNPRFSNEVCPEYGEIRGINDPPLVKKFSFGLEKLRGLGLISADGPCFLWG
jgi:hypothetical protein